MLSPTAFLTIVSAGGLLSLLIMLLMRNVGLLIRVGTFVPTFLITFIMVRLCIPYEFGFENSIYLEFALPPFRDFLTIPVPFFGQQKCVVDYLIYIWVIGFITCSLYQIITYIRFIINLYKTEHHWLQQTHEVFKRLCDERDDNVHFRLLQSFQYQIPMCVGIIHPIIVMPVSYEYTAEEWRCMIIHEMAHHDHHDAMLKLLCGFLCTVYWWNPFIYLLRNQLVLATEHHSDLTVLKHNISAREYIACLKRVLLQAKRSKKTGMLDSAYTMSLLGVKSNMLDRRIKLIKRHEKKTISKPKCFRILASILLSTIFIFSFSFVLEPRYVDPNEGYVNLTSQNAYIIQKPDGQYDIYANDEHFLTTDHIWLEISALPIYKSLDEIKDIK